MLSVQVDWNRCDIDFFEDLGRLDRVDWAVMKSRYWYDTATDPDRKRRRQAEFLVHEFCPWALIQEVGVFNSTVQSDVERILEGGAHRPPVHVHRDWYY